VVYPSRDSTGIDDVIRTVVDPATRNQSMRGEADSRRIGVCRQPPATGRGTRATWRRRREHGTADDCRTADQNTYRTKFNKWSESFD